LYLDDILLLSPTALQAQRHTKRVVESLMQAGFKINLKKSLLQPCQQLTHLGMVINLKDGKLQVPPEKLKTIRKELGKVLTKDQLSCRKIASILGQIRSYLVALPFLRLVTGQLLRFSLLAQENGWDFPIQIPSSLKEEIKELHHWLQPGQGRPFLSQPSKILHSDSSTFAWGGG